MSEDSSKKNWLVQGLSAINWPKVGGFLMVVANLSMAIFSFIAVHYVVRDSRQQDRVWSAQQIATIFDQECSTKPADQQATKETDCPPKSSVQSRAVAVRYFVALEGHGGKAKLRQANLNQADLAGEDLSNVDFTAARFESADLSDAILERTKLSLAVLNQSFLARADLSGADLKKASLIRTKLRDAKLRGTDLEEALLGPCVQNSPTTGFGGGMDLGSGEDDQTADLRGADLEGASLTNASLCGVDLTSVKGLTQEQLESARGDGNTRLPSGYTRPKAWLTKLGAKTAGKETKKEEKVAPSPAPKTSQPLSPHH